MPVTTTIKTTTTTRRDGTQVTKRKTTRSKTPDTRLPARSRSFGVPSRTRSKSLTRSSLTEALGLLGETGHSDNAEFKRAVQRAIPAEFVLIASQDDVTQAQEDYYALEHYQLGHCKKNGAGSVATCALLEFMYEHPSSWVASNNAKTTHSVLEIVQEIKKRVKRASKLDAKPTLSSSRPLGPPTYAGTSSNPFAPFYIVPPGFTGTRRALLIGVRSGTGRGPKTLKGTGNDLSLVQSFLQRHCRFSPEHIHILLEDPGETQPTRHNILKLFAKMVALSQPKDVLFVQYSGHGGRTGNNLFIIPSDYATAGEIKDEIILRDLIKAMPANTHTTMLVDCCYSGTVGDLPYILQENNTPSSMLRSSSTTAQPKQQIETFFDTDTRQEVLQKEANNDTTYWELRHARAEQRVYDRITLPGKLIAEAAERAGAAATQVMQDMGQGLSQAATSASEAGTAALEALNSSFSALSMDGSFSALSLDGSFASGGERKTPKRTASSKKSGGNESLSSFFSKNNNKETRGGGGSKSGASESNKSIGAGSSTMEAMNSSLSNFMGKASLARKRMASLQGNSDTRSVDDSTVGSSTVGSFGRKNVSRMPPRTRSSDGTTNPNNSVPSSGMRRGGRRPMARAHTHSGPGSGLADAAAKAKAALADAKARKEAVERSRREAEAAREARRQSG